MQLAPSRALLPCSSVGCCWRWAGRELLQDCAQARAESNAYRSVFKEEMGDSILQRFLNLEREHMKLLASLKQATTELKKCEKRCRELEHQFVFVSGERDDALQRLETVEMDLAVATERNVQIKTELDKLSDELREMVANTGIKELRRRCNEAETRLSEVELASYRELALMKKDLEEERASRCDAQFKLKQLEGMEQELMRQNKNRRRGKNTPTVIPPAKPK